MPSSTTVKKDVVVVECQHHLAGAGARMPAGVGHQLTCSLDQGLGERVGQYVWDLAGNMATIVQMPSGGELVAKRVDGGQEAGLMECRGSQLPHQSAQLAKRLIEQGPDLLETVDRPWLFLRRELDQDTGQHELLDGRVVERVGKAAPLTFDRPQHVSSVLADQEVGGSGHRTRILAAAVYLPSPPAVSERMTSSKLKEDGLWRGGKSLKLETICPAIATPGVPTHWIMASIHS